jgi:hypothetical protein
MLRRSVGRSSGSPILGVKRRGRGEVRRLPPAAIASRRCPRNRPHLAPARCWRVRRPLLPAESSRPRARLWARGSAKAAAGGGSQPTLPAKPAAPDSSKVSESAKAVAAGGIKSTQGEAVKVRELPSPWKRVADFGTNISVDDYFVGKFFFDRRYVAGSGEGQMVVVPCWGLVLKCYELRTRQHRMLNVNVLRPRSIIPLRIMNFGRRLTKIRLRRLNLRNQNSLDYIR